MIRHREQHEDDRTTKDTPRAPKNIREKDPVTAAAVRQWLYLQDVGVLTKAEEFEDIEFAALTGPDFGPTGRWQA